MTSSSTHPSITFRLTIRAALALGLLGALASFAPAGGRRYGEGDPSIHQIQAAENRDVVPPPAPPFAKNRTRCFSSTPAVNRMVMGFYTYWKTGTANLRWDLLTHLAYFSAEATTAGDLSALHGWPGSAPIAEAHAHGVKVLLTVTLFGSTSIRTLLQSSTARGALVDNLLAQVSGAGADGVVVDFETPASSEKALYAAFVGELAAAFHAALPGSHVCVCTPSVNWGDGIPLRDLAERADSLFIMGYDYYYSGGNPGPVAPLSHPSGSPWATWAGIEQTLQDYLYGDVGVGDAYRGKLILGVPYYGIDWPTTGTGVPTASAGTGTARVYTSAAAAAATYGRLWDPWSSTPYYGYFDASQPHQCWFDDAESLGLKYERVNALDLGGTGMWALNYDGSRTELWDSLREHFTTQPNQPPAPAPDLAVVTAGQSVRLAVLANDTDPDGDPLTLGGILQRPKMGIAKAGADGTVLYIAGGSLEGADSFTYRVVDPEGAWGEGRVVIDYRGPAQLPLPPRPADALPGSGLHPAIRSLSLADREARIQAEFEAGNVPDFMRKLVPVTSQAMVGGQLRTLVFYVTPDYFCLGSNTDFLRVPVSAHLAQRIADRAGCLLPTRKMVNAIWAQAEVKLAPYTFNPADYDITSPDIFYQHNQQIEIQRANQPLGALVAGIKKDICITPLLPTMPSPARVAIYGWHQLNGAPIQPLSLVHQQDYMDYSHGARLVRCDVLLDGRVAPMADLLADPDLASLLSDEGAFTEGVRYPVPLPSLVTNGSFEGAYTDGVSEGWTAWTAPGSAALTFGRASINHHDGAYSQYWKRTDTAAADGAVHQRLAVVPGKTYALSLWMKRQSTFSGSFLKAGIDLTGGTDPSGAGVVYTDFTGSTDNVWQSFTADVTATGPWLTIFARAGHTGTTGGTTAYFYVDEVTLVEE
ncbi:MAG: carbohydrate binding domain-containing protein [Acidobacteria bacterium]|nr:carbohydrate binding domain-containing protein [Acidobacteriota bacterium]